MGKRGREPEDLTGVRSGMIEVVEMVLHQGRTKCKCLCDCGKSILVWSYNVKSGHTKSCGCSNKKNKNSSCWKGCGEISGTCWYHIKHNAKTSKKVGGVFSITIEEAWNLYQKQSGKCALTGEPISFATTNKGFKSGEATASLDRIDSSKGYIEGNVQWVHKDINMMKSDFEEKDFKRLCRLVYEYENCRRP